MDGRGSCVSLSDTIGSLSFYANHTNILKTKVWNSLNDTVSNSDSLAGDGFYGGLVIVPQPSVDSIYYLFTIYGSSTNLYYHIINSKYNNGQGKVVQKNIGLIFNDVADCITAVKHGNGRDWWLIAKSANGAMTNKFYVYLIDSSGISAPAIQNFNNATNVGFQKLIFNSNGTKLMQITLASFMCEFDFDRCTGIISNPNVIFPESTGPLFWEGSYSPNDSILYVTTNPDPFTMQEYLLQYNLYAINIPLSCDTLESFQHPIGSGAVRLAPNGKIYFSRAYECNAFPYCYPYPDSARNYVNENLSVINNPNVVGAGCNYQPFSFYLGGKRTYYGLPNNPNYDLGPLTGSPCDTLTGISPTPALPEEEGALYVYYHPVWQKTFINAKGLKGKNVKMSVYDLLGNVVYTDLTPALSTGEGGAGGYFSRDLNCAAFAKGMYIVSLVTEKERMVKKFIKE
jgi:hypothetical protein